MARELPIDKGQVTEVAKTVPATHTVGERDTINNIALFYKVSVGDLLEANNLQGSVLRTGQKLKLPASARTKK